MKIANNIALCVTLFVGLLLSSPLAVEARNEALPDTVSYIIMIDTDEPVPLLTEDEINARAIQITYRVNRTDINPRDKGYRQLLQQLKRINKDKDFICRMIVVQGAASPEGPFARNKWLGEQRAKALTDSVARYMDVDSLNVQNHNVVENYAMLYSLVKAGNDSYRSVVLKIIDDNRGNLVETKSALQRLDGGHVWESLYHKYFPMLRSACVVMFVSHKKEVHIDNRVIVENPLPVVSAPSEDSVWVETRQPMFAVKTNMLYDFAFALPGFGWLPSPNATIEFYPRRGHISVAAEVIHPGWRNDNTNKTWIIHNYLLEGRYYLRGNALFTGHYFSVYAHMGNYDIQKNATVSYLGDDMKYNWGAGIGWGWAKRLGSDSRWKFEVNFAIGYFHTRYDQYHPAEEWVTEGGDFFYNWHKDPSKFVKKSNSFSWQGPTRVGVSISYDIIDYKHKRIKVRKGTEK